MLVVSGADPGFFLGGGALVSCSTSTPINHIVFFFQNTSCIWKPQVISGGGGAHPPHPPPRSAPVFLSFFLFSCFGFFPFLTYFLSVWRFFEKCISTIKIDWLYRKSSKVLKFFERNFFKNFWKKSGVGPEKTADIWWYYHWFPHHMTSETSAEIPYWWCVTTQIWVVLLIGCVAWEIWFNQWEALPRSGSFGRANQW